MIRSSSGVMSRPLVVISRCIRNSAHNILDAPFYKAPMPPNQVMGCSMGVVVRNYAQMTDTQIYSEKNGPDGLGEKHQIIQSLHEGCFGGEFKLQPPIISNCYEILSLYGIICYSPWREENG